MTTDTSTKMIKRDIGSSTAEFTITNYTSTTALNADSDADAVICDVLATVIRELINQGILKGSVSTA